MGPCCFFREPLNTLLKIAQGSSQRSQSTLWGARAGGRGAASSRCEREPSWTCQAPDLTDSRKSPPVSGPAAPQGREKE